MCQWNNDHKICGMGRRRDDYKLKFCITAINADLMLTGRTEQDFTQLSFELRTAKAVVQISVP